MAPAFLYRREKGMTTLYIVRHGEARGNVERNFHGWYDSDLTENGRAQIARLPKYFENIHIDAVFSSDLKRTRETAHAVADSKGLPVLEDAALREIHGGEWEDVPWDDLPVRFPESYGHWLERPHLLEMPGGERMTDFADRIYGAVMKIAKAHEGQNIVIATHGTAIKVLLCKVRGIPLSKMPEEAWCDNASVTVLEWEGENASVLVDGDNSHLLDISTLAGQVWWRKKEGERMLALTNRVYLSKLSNYNREKAEAVLIPMLESILKDNEFSNAWEGKKVVIKPNLLAKRPPSAAVTANPTLVSIAASYFADRGATVVIADSPGGLYSAKLLEKLYAVTGMQKAAEESGATLNLDTSSENTGNFTIIKPLLEADLIVSISRMKTHMLCNMTAAVKNVFGSIPGAKKAEYHARYPKKDDFCGMLVDLCLENAPCVNIVDCVVAMEGNGPAGGTLRRVGALLGSANPFAADLLCAEMMGFTPDEVDTVRISRARGLCPESTAELSIIGEDPAKYTHRFKRPKASRDAGLLKLLPRTIAARLRKERRPVILEKKCIGCGECARACPAETIEIVEKKAKIHPEACIKCYCCQELCPKKAVVVK